MKEIIKQVEEKLKEHMGLKQQLKALEYELDGFQYPLNANIIEAKVFAHSGGDRVAGSEPRNQTADIVVEHVDHQRNANYRAILDKVESLRVEVRRLEYYLSLLPVDDADVIRRFYFEGLSLPEISVKDDVSLSTVRRRKKQGFATLVGYYSMLDELSS